MFCIFLHHRTGFTLGKCSNFQCNLINHLMEIETCLLLFRNSRLNCSIFKSTDYNLFQWVWPCTLRSLKNGFTVLSVSLNSLWTVWGKRFVLFHLLFSPLFLLYSRVLNPFMVIQNISHDVTWCSNTCTLYVVIWLFICCTKLLKHIMYSNFRWQRSSQFRRTCLSNYINEREKGGCLVILSYYY